MKKINFYFVGLMAFLVLFSSCDKTEMPDPFPSELVKGCYIMNYGSYGSGGASISRYDYETDQMTNFYYRSQNGGTELLSNIQYIYPFQDSIFMLGHTPDQLLTVNPLFEQHLNGITDVDNPRFCIASGDYLYISCWGPQPDYSEMAGSYIAKLNIGTGAVEEKISVPGGPEGLEMAKGKLYAALNYTNKVAVVDLENNAVTYITTPAVTSYFMKDKNNNLYVTLLSTYSNYSDETGLGFINTTSDQVETYYTLENVSTGYGSMIQPDKFRTKIYLATSEYDANWNLTGAVAVFDLQSKTFQDNFVSDISSLSGISVNPDNNDVYVFTSPTVTGAGTMKIYDKEGSFIKEFEVGAAPTGAIFLD